MYPYPSGDLHIGHWYIVTPTDAIGRFKRMHGYNVFFPIGFDAFGLPAENAAIKSGIHPRDWTIPEHRNMRRQLRDDGRHVRLGQGARHRATRPTTAGTSGSSCSSWRRAWPIAQMAPVDWCPKDQVVLAREQVIGRRPGVLALRHAGRQARPGAMVLPDHRIRRRAAGLRRSGLPGADQGHADQLDRPIGGRGDRLHGRAARRPAGGEQIRVFTTRPDTLFGATFMVLAPEHPLVDSLTSPDAESGGGAVPIRGPAKVGDRPAVDRPREDRSGAGQPTRSTRSTANWSRSGSPTTC